MLTTAWFYNRVCVRTHKEWKSPVGVYLVWVLICLWRNTLFCHVCNQKKTIKVICLFHPSANHFSGYFIQVRHSLNLHRTLQRQQTMFRNKDSAGNEDKFRHKAVNRNAFYTPRRDNEIKYCFHYTLWRWIAYVQFASIWNDPQTGYQNKSTTRPDIVLKQRQQQK